MNPLFKKPSAWIPIALSLLMLATLLLDIGLFGVVRDADEEAMAHLFQIWVFVELFLVAFFAFTWGRRKPRQTLSVLLVQILAALVPIALVFFLQL